MKDVPGFVWLQRHNNTWFLAAIDDIRVVTDGDADGTATIVHRAGGEFVVLHTVKEIGEMITESRCEEIRMREQVRDEFRRLP
jgi:hypothetical protein